MSSSSQNDTKASFTSKQNAKRKVSKKRNTRRKQGGGNDIESTTMINRNATGNVAPKAVVNVDEASVPVQEVDVSPINAVGFESGNIEYVRPTPDTAQVPGQRYWVMSYVTSAGKNIRSKNTMVKCSGCFGDELSAGKHAEIIRNTDPRINVFVVEMYNFISVPIPMHIFEGLRKHYIDERLDRIMYENYLEVKRDRKLMEMRTKADKEKALANIRQAKGDASYVPSDHTEFVQEQMKQESDRYHDMKNAESNFEGAEIIAALQKVMKDAVAPKNAEVMTTTATTTTTPSSPSLSSVDEGQQQTSPVSPSPSSSSSSSSSSSIVENKEIVEAFATKLLETLIDIKQRKIETELLQQEQNKSLIEHSIKDKHVPAISDFDTKEKKMNETTAAVSPSSSNCSETTTVKTTEDDVL